MDDKEAKKEAKKRPITRGTNIGACKKRDLRSKRHCIAGRMGQRKCHRICKKLPRPNIKAMAEGERLGWLKGLDMATLQPTTNDSTM